MKNFFHDWTIDHYEAVSPKKEYILWIAGGLERFEDKNHYPTKFFLTGLGYWKKRKLWKELQIEINRRACMERDKLSI